MPSRNRAPLLRDAIEDLLAQDYPNDRYELIVVDDGSGDSTPALVEQLRRRRQAPRTVGISQSSSGLNTARNTGIAAAQGNPICLVDDDVHVPPSWLRAIVAALERHPGPVCVGGRIQLELEAPPPRNCGRHSIGESELELGPDEHQVELVYGANMGMWREALDLVGGFDERLLCGGDDTEWERRLARAGGTVFYAPDAWLLHRRTVADLTSGSMVKRAFLRGRLCGRNVTYTRDPMSYTRTAGLIAGYLRHAATARCCIGLICASMASGCLAGQFEGSLRSLGRGEQAPMSSRRALADSRAQR